MKHALLLSLLSVVALGSGCGDDSSSDPKLATPATTKPTAAITAEPDSGARASGALIELPTTSPAPAR
ncbi:MAG: hypothetical protein QOF78_3190 [Phycisphaerales bacterium]|jgi:hypothetical protein|nr:hypothetical protein [Phycisphaerales bacterium]